MRVDDDLKEEEQLLRHDPLGSTGGGPTPHEVLNLFFLPLAGLPNFFAGGSCIIILFRDVEMNCAYLFITSIYLLHVILFRDADDVEETINMTQPIRPST